MDFKKNRRMVYAIVCLISILCASSSAQTFNELKILNTEVFTWIKTILQIGGFIWLVITVAKAWVRGQIAEATTWYSILGLIAGILIVGNLDTIYQNILSFNPLSTGTTGP